MDSQSEPSQASFQYAPEPIAGSTLFEIETERRSEISRRGTLRTGCREVDEQVLVDGFERGAVVGISAEEIDTGLLLALQTVAHNLVYGTGDEPAVSRAAIITTLAAPAILPTLRDVIKAQVQSKLGGGHAGINAQVRQCLECISVSRVFDIEGLWEVLSELEFESPTLTPKEEVEGPGDEVPPALAEEPDSSPLSSPPSSLPSSPVTELPPLRAGRIERTEIMDSEDEGGLSSVPSSSPAPPDPVRPPTREPESTSSPPMSKQSVHEPQKDPPNIPGIILITHFSTLLNALFTQRDKTSSHTILQLLSSHLRYLSRSSGSLVVLLNSTSNPPSSTVANLPSKTGPTAPGPPGTRPSERPLNPTLQSIFNPPPPTHLGYGSSSMTLSRRNKPAFGLTFAQFLDLHLLCTRLPKTPADAEALSAPDTGSAAAGAMRKVKYAWIVEVLLDETGFRDTAGKSIDREQRWGAVDIRDGAKIVDAFEKQEKHYSTEMFRLAAGFGGRRV
ncbi:hypothetical protein SUNI508_09605 [Seiridium unicorne]|uniref:Uncharacterized protein n=1 Tax=Seiridium unicorne TaxID=138068 RepID=A0ABR2UPV5_9PEZI